MPDTVEEKKQDKLQDYINLNQLAEIEFAEKFWLEGEENARFRRGKHWSETGEDAHEAQGRIAYNIPFVESKFNAIESQQMQSPFDIICLPRTNKDAVNAEIKTSIFKYLHETNDFIYLISEWFRDGLIKKYGVVRRYIDRTDDIEGDIRVEKLLYDYCLYDTNCKRYNIARYAQWTQEVSYYTRDQLKDEYPDKKDEIDKMAGYSEGTDTANTGKFKFKNWQRKERGQELIKVVKHNQRGFKTIWKVTTNDGKTIDSEKKVDINPDLPPKEIQLQMAQAGQLFPISCIKRSREYIETMVFTKSIETVLETYETDSKYMPMHFYFSNWDDGEVWTLMDLVKSPQKFLDRLTSQIDASIGKLIKNSYEVDWNQLDKKDQARWEELAQDLTSGGAVLRRVGKDRIVYAVDSGHVPPELFTTWQFMVKVLNDLMGGANATGQKESDAESGKAVDLRQEAASMLVYLFIYNLGRSVKELAEGLNEDINEVYGNATDRIIEVSDTDMEEEVKQVLQAQGIYEKAMFKSGLGYLYINSTNDKNKTGQMLGEAKTRIIIEKGQYSPRVKEMKKNQWLVINKMKIEAGEKPYPVSMFKDDFELSPSVSAKMEKFDEEQVQLAKQQAEMEKQKMLFEARRQHMDDLKTAHDTINATEKHQKELAENGEKK